MIMSSYHLNNTLYSSQKTIETKEGQSVLIY